MQPTKEQSEAVELFASGLSLAIEAGAGTGKTTTLKLLGKATPKRGHYIAFNRAIVSEARERMPSNVAASTAHSLAFKAQGSRYRHRLDSPRMRSDEIARMLDVRHFVVSYGSERKVLQPGYLAGLVMRAVLQFCFSSDDAPSHLHVPYIDGIDLPDSNGRRTWRNNEAVRRELSPAIKRAWADLTNIEGSLPFRHDHYLKLWQLNDPKIPSDFILFDEAQDAAPVMLAAVEAQTHAQLVFVGDSQQQIYEWRGAVNALEKVPAEARTFLSQSFRFGEAIADVANDVLDVLDAELRLTGTDSIDSRVTACSDPRAILTRSNAGAVSTVLELQRHGASPHLIGGGADVLSFAKAAQELRNGNTTSHPELACFTSWGEVQEYVAQDPQGGELRLLVSLVDEYGVPTIERALGSMPAEREASCVVSTAHKAKGREWESVQLGDDFGMPTDDAQGEWRLLYVAATRAQQLLDLTACEPLVELRRGGRDPDVASSITSRLDAAFDDDEDNE